MNFIFFSTTNNFNSFHRKREIESIASELNSDNNNHMLLYFNAPKFFILATFLWLLRKNTKKASIDTVKVLNLYVLLPVSWVFNNRVMMYFFVTLPVKLQVYYAKKRYLAEGAYINWFYKPDQYLYLKSNGPYIYLHYDNYKKDANYRFSKNCSYDLTVSKCIASSVFTLVTSYKIYQNFMSKNKSKVFYYPNAISRTLLKDCNYRCDKAGSKKIGFIGQLDSTFDIELVCKISSEYKNDRVFLIGPINDLNAEKELKKLENVELVGYMEYEELSNKIELFDIGICPYRQSEFNNYRNPLKIMEYFSYGLPVVTIECDVNIDARRLVGIAEAHDDFLKLIKIEMDTDSKEKFIERKKIAAVNCWDNRAAFVIDRLHNTYMTN